MTDDLTPFGTISLGAMIRLLETRDRTDSVYYNFGYFAPVGIGSYRGYYDHLALGFEVSEEVKVGALIATLKGALGKTYQGYKGGDFTMYDDSPLWVANYGECSGTTILGLADCDYRTIIATGFAG